MVIHRLKRGRLLSVSSLCHCVQQDWVICINKRIPLGSDHINTPGSKMNAFSHTKLFSGYLNWICGCLMTPQVHIDGLVQKSSSSSALGMELHLPCINPSIYSIIRRDKFWLIWNETWQSTAMSPCYIDLPLTHCGPVTHICVIKLTIIGSDNGLSPGRRQAIIWPSAGILLIGTLGTNFSVILSEIHTFFFKKIRLKASSAKWWPCCLGLNELVQSKMYITRPKAG